MTYHLHSTAGADAKRVARTSMCTFWSASCTQSITDGSVMTVRSKLPWHALVCWKGVDQAAKNYQQTDGLQRTQGPQVKQLVTAFEMAANRAFLSCPPITHNIRSCTYDLKFVKL